MTETTFPGVRPSGVGRTWRHGLATCPCVVQFPASRDLQDVPRSPAPAAGPKAPEQNQDKKRQTHLVMIGQFKYSGYESGQFIYALDDDRQLARRSPSGKWSRPVREARDIPGRYDHIRALPGPAVQINLTKGEFY